MARAADGQDDAAQSAARRAGGLVAGLCLGIRAKEHRVDPDGTLRLYAEPALSGLDDDCVRVCRRGGELDHSDYAGPAVRGDLSSNDTVGGTLSAGALCGLQ